VLTRHDVVTVDESGTVALGPAAAVVLRVFRAPNRRGLTC